MAAAGGSHSLLSCHLLLQFLLPPAAWLLEVEVEVQVGDLNLKFSLLLPHI